MRVMGVVDTEADVEEQGQAEGSSQIQIGPGAGKISNWVR